MKYFNWIEKYVTLLFLERKKIKQFKELDSPSNKLSREHILKLLQADNTYNNVYQQNIAKNHSEKKNPICHLQHCSNYSRAIKDFHATKITHLFNWPNFIQTVLAKRHPPGLYLPPFCTRFYVYVYVDIFLPSQNNKREKKEKREYVLPFVLFTSAQRSAVPGPTPAGFLPYDTIHTTINIKEC